MSDASIETVEVTPLPMFLNKVVMFMDMCRCKEDYEKVFLWMRDVVTHDKFAYDKETGEVTMYYKDKPVSAIIVPDGFSI